MAEDVALHQPHVIDPRNNDIVLVAATGDLSDPARRSIYKTTDGSRT
jgi:hypothetical protein